MVSGRPDASMVLVSFKSIHDYLLDTQVKQRAARPLREITHIERSKTRHRRRRR